MTAACQSRASGPAHAGCHEHERDRGTGPRQDLRRQPRRGRRRPHRAHRDRVRGARAQRCRQDHDHPHARHAAAARRRRGAHLRPRRGPRGLRRPLPHRGDRPVRVGRRDAERHREPGGLRAPARPVPPRRAGQVRRAPGGVLADRRRQAAAAQLLRRHAPSARPGGEPDRPAAAHLPGRAHHGPEPPHAQPDVGHDPPPGRRRLHRAAHHPVPRRGRPARRPDRRHRPRPGRRRGYCRRAQGHRRRPVAPGRHRRAG